MNDEELKKLVMQWGYTGKDAETALRMCKEVERLTRQRYFSFIQRANNAAEMLALTPRELEKIVFDKTSEATTKC